MYMHIYVNIMNKALRIKTKFSRWGGKFNYCNCLVQKYHQLKRFIKFDIENFYLSISEGLPTKVCYYLHEPIG